MSTQEQEIGTAEERRAMHAALAAAAEKVRAVAKASRNEHHRYSYASSEDVLVAAREAMDGSGLAVVPTDCDIVQVGDLYVLKRSFELTHSGGASKLCRMSWPLEINKGKTPDKAAAGAETTSFAYFLRTLLRMPRLAEDDINHDSHEPPRATRSAPAVARPAVPMLSAKGKAALAKIEAIDSEEAFLSAEKWLSGLIDKREAGVDTGFPPAELDVFLSALEAKR